MPTYEQPNPSSPEPESKDRQEVKTPPADPVGMRFPTPVEQTPPSLWLYLAGLCVTLSGLYAVNYSLEDSRFSTMTYSLAVIGYALSYVLRSRRVASSGLHIPALLCIGILLFSGIYTGQGMEWFLPSLATDDRAKSLQLVFAWLGILHSFTLSTDAAVLFSCVPCMTMIALVSTTTSEYQIQNAFLVFIGAATFLMVHENYLRTRAAMLQGRAKDGGRRLFGGQLQLTAFCIIGALALANVVAVPIRTVGQTLFVASALTPLSNPNSKPNRPSGPQVTVNESGSIELANGPVTESDTPLLRVRANRGLYWRGTTFDFYTGTRFENHAGQGVTLSPESGGVNEDQLERDYIDPTGPANSSFRAPRNLFKIPTSALELPPNDMKDSQVSKYSVTIIGGAFSQIYGAGNMVELNGPFPGLSFNAAGGLLTTSVLDLNTEYQVTSRVADDDPDHLRAAPSEVEAVPASIAQRYLQVIGNDQTENLKLRALARSLTRGLKNNYDKVYSLKKYIEDTCKYNLQAAKAPRNRDVVEYFLYDSHEGYCDSFGAALTMLCRYAGIPARLASGFLSGDLKDGDYVVREKHKHLWTEVFFPHIGWVPFDATEGAEDISDHSGKSKEKKTGFLAWLATQGGLPALLGVMIVGLLAYVVKTELLDRMRPRRVVSRSGVERPPTNAAIIAAYAAACLSLARRGLPRPAYMTPDEFARLVAERTDQTLPDLEAPLTRLTTLCTRFHYGPEVATEDDVRAARESVAAITQILSKARKGALAPATA